MYQSSECSMYSPYRNVGSDNDMEAVFQNNLLDARIVL